MKDMSFSLPAWRAGQIFGSLRAFAAALSVGILVLSSCGKNKVEASVDVSGEWKLETFSGVAADETDMDIDVYVKFDGQHFELFQKLGGGHYSKYDGTYSIAGNILSGRYSDGNPWGSRYEVSLQDGALTMHSLDTGAGVAETCVYVKSQIPDAVRKDAADYSGTRSVAGDFSLRIL